jgi:hypothetical protein
MPTVPPNLAQSWRTDTIIHRLAHATSVLLSYFTRWELPSQYSQNRRHLIHSMPSSPPAPLHLQHAVIPWNSQVQYLGLLLDPKLLFTKHLTSVTHKATGVFLQLPPHLARDSTLSIPNKITLYQVFIRSVLTYAAPVWSNTSSSKNRRLQILQSKCLRVIGKLPPAHLHPTSSRRLKRHANQRLHLSFDR